MLDVIEKGSEIDNSSHDRILTIYSAVRVDGLFAKYYICQSPHVVMTSERRTRVESTDPARITARR